MRGLLVLTFTCLFVGAIGQMRSRRLHVPQHWRNYGFGRPQNLVRPRRNGNIMVGPHVCKENGQSFCCPGWTTLVGSNKCIQAVCDPNQCGDGVCIQPKKCICQNGAIATSCGAEPRYRTGQRCGLRCMNGGECVNNECACSGAFTGAHCSQPICGPGCQNGGRCISPNKCLCTYGFTGNRCQTDYRVGPCFLTRANDTCMDQIEGVTCNKKICCATIGQGWGIPCEECPARAGNCSRGRMPPHCEDINECQMIPGLCKDGECVNTDGSFRCECADGYVYNNKLHKCEDIDECLEGYCENGECSNTVGGFMCKCPPDYLLSSDQTYCISDKPGFCYTSIESGLCATPLPQLTRRTECCCSTVGEHEQETLGKCFAVPNSNPERCPTLGTPEFDRDCQTDTMLGIYDRPAPLVGAGLLSSLMGHPCASNLDACGKGVCVEVLSISSGWKCQCDEGYIQDKNTKTCVDKNECGDGMSERDICGLYGTCVNSIGSYSCHCDPGFANGEDMISCIDIDECAEAPEGLCENGRCVNNRGSFICSCDEGYRQTATRQACEDYDECVEDNDLCEFGRCVNIIGAFRCVCNPGFVESADKRSCKDENECEATGMCEHGSCINRNGGFECMCDNGFEITHDGKHCVDIDECKQKPCINGECENLIGDFRCHCHRFQQLDESGRRCLLESRVANCFRNVRNGQCNAENALTALTTRAECCCAVPGGMSAWDDCEPCPERGSENHGVLCSGVTINNICAMHASPCDNGACINMEGNNYRCECHPGFLPTADQKACVDIDECSESMQCSNGQCRNTPGSFVCTCDPGFVLKGDVCEDIPECESNPCINGECVDLPGSFECRCEEGSMLDINGLACYNVQMQQCWKSYENNTCSDNFRVLTAEACCNSIGVAWGNKNCIPCTEIELRCQKGYMYNVATDECDDIPECSYGACDPLAECIETEGSFQCICPEHLTLDSTRTVCLDIRVGTCFWDFEESTNECSNPTFGAVMRKSDCCCTVGQGWRHDSNACEGCPVEGTAEFDKLCPLGKTGGTDGKLGPTVNECIRFPDLCNNGICENTVDSFICRCNIGFTLDETGRMCNDIDECDISIELCGEGECVNTDGSFNCICKEGYTLSSTGDFCEDDNECIAGGKCTGGDCLNTDGSYECRCPQGRALSPDGTRCVDVDECLVMKDLCKPYGECVNMLGFFVCVCDPGFETTEDKTICVDKDECAIENGGCSTICVNTIGSYECRCEEGFTLTFDGHTCADVDECMDQPSRCDGGRCENIEGSFQCVCFDGFMATMDFQYCEDMDECAMNPNICMNGKCHNTRGSYTCNCDQGYCVPQGQMICVDEDECELGKHTCDVNADCSNTDGGFECSCIDGFSGDGFDCIDEDECTNGNNTCDENAECDNTHGSYACNCDDGFHGDGFSCSDKDDCLADENLCGPHGTCLNIQGSFECECPMGFMTTADKKACKDIDECAIEHICVNGRCHNVPGTFRCECLKGFEKDEQGANCTDIDECDDVANCINGECVNSIGTYECQCPEGFTPNPGGVGCVDTRTGDCFLRVEGDENAPICSRAIGVDVVRATCCCSYYAQAWGNPCEICPERNTSEYQTLCPGGDGFKPNPITVFLEDIDECMELPGLCQGGKCVNVFGSFICECPEGYKLNEESRVCEDVDECTEAEAVCGPGTCVNSVGGYSCLCPDGYKPINRGRICEDEREAFCYRYYNESSFQCTEQLPFNVTKKLCCCTGQIGQGWNNPCEVCPIPGDGTAFKELCGVDIYEPGELICKKVPDLCLNGICVDTDTGYQCECPMGFRYNEAMLMCEDIDECAADENICRINAQCVNLQGSYRCSCKDGYTDRNGECVDVDECIEQEACSNGQCENREGGFLCICNQGFKSINDEQACEDVDECDFDPCGFGNCQNMVGSYICTCYNGFTLSDNGDCVDTDECVELSVCRNGLCINEDGSYSCMCDDGYKVARDGRSCIDANECMEDAAVCGEGSCQNMDGSFKCFCPDGYSSPDGKSCIDDDECELLDMCTNGDCVNTPGSFTCVCPPNFALSTNKKLCIDQTKGQCYSSYDLGVCSNEMPTAVTRGSCCCTCTDSAWGESAGECEACPAEGTQEFENLCPEGCGFTPNGDDINECVTNNPCVNGICRNLAGGFKCECRTGFKLDETNFVCVDEDECVERGNPCGPGTCSNRVGGFHCECEDGYYNGPMMKCLDINECLEQTHGCKFRCVNTDGSYVCTCPDGYKLNDDERSCSDIDECSDDDLNRCEEKGMLCKNAVGSFECLCQPGYKKVGVADQCENIDECLTLGVCAGGECIDLEGSYQCRCGEGYIYDEQGRRCIDNREGLCYAAVHQRTCELTATTGFSVSKTSCCCNNGAGWGPDCDICPLPSSKEFVKLCPHGPGFDERGEDIDDCIVFPGLCANGTCTNLLGSYKCICDRGFMPTENMQACIDIDECAMPNGCAGGSRCRNTFGGYKCECPAGYQITNTMRCVDVDECTRKDHQCQFICINTIGSYHCGCPHGFAMHNNQSCVDQDECKMDPDICGENADCENDVGGYHCVCAPGFEKTPNGDGCIGLPCDSRPGICGPQMCMNVGESIRCVPGCNPNTRLRFHNMRCYDINDCRANPCKFGGRCVPNAEGQYRCTGGGCGRGFAMMGGYGRGCGDINECRFQNNPCSYQCQNSYGGFKCGCPRGYFGLGGSQCMNGMGGFQQPPVYPQQYGQLPFMGGRGAPMGRCYDCGPVGPHRQRRSTESAQMEMISGDDENRPPVNTSVPIIMHLSLQNLNPRQRLIQLIPAIRTLKDHTLYKIIGGNEGRMFRIHKQDSFHFIHLNRGFEREEGKIEPGQYKIKVEAKPTIDKKTAKKASLDNPQIEKAMENTVKFEVLFDIEK
uniref:fibrillin-2-like isoform X1 n=1 Tax=Styela clava TaxID=7725 RepID=UPI001939DEB5|nr:fibrillin-2-like isoform X1 [Styela clava]